MKQALIERELAKLRLKEVETRLAEERKRQRSEKIKATKAAKKARQEAAAQAALAPEGAPPLILTISLRN